MQARAPGCRINGKIAHAVHGSGLCYIATVEIADIHQVAAIGARLADHALPVTGVSYAARPALAGVCSGKLVRPPFFAAHSRVAGGAYAFVAGAGTAILTRSSSALAFRARRIDHT